MEGEAPVYLALDYGPHGGWHGHYDKLGFVLFALGMEAAVDPGTHSYALAIHDEYDRVTVAHNTVVVDMITQQAATGELLGRVFLPDVSIAKVDAGEACAEAALVREMLVTDRYVIDRFDVQSLDGGSHRYDWVLHTRGVMEEHGGAASPYAFGSGDGYGYLGDTEGIDVSLPARFRWNFSEAGTWWGSESGIDASFVIEGEEAAGGQYSGKMHYDFSAATGYIIFSVSPPDTVPAGAAPDGLLLDLYGDGSGNALHFRLYDSTVERFVYDAGTLDFTGWRHFELSDVASWSHFLGNDDGVFDPPVGLVSVQVSHETGGSAVSDLYVDTIQLVYGDSVMTVRDFEVEKRYLNVYVPAESGGGGLEIVSGTGPSSWSETIPFIMMRKQARDASFLSLLQPARSDSGDEAVLKPLDPAVCDAAGCRGYTVEHPLFTDGALWDSGFGPGSSTIEMTETESGRTYSTDGLLGFCRKEGAGGAFTRMALVAGTHTTCESTLLLESSSAVERMQVDVAEEGGRVDVTADLLLENELRILAPLARAAYLNGSEVSFERDGDYIIINAMPTVSDEGEWGEGAEIGEPVDAAADGDADVGEGDDGSGKGCGCRVVM